MRLKGLGQLKEKCEYMQNARLQLISLAQMETPN
jgi:hypothetical protein